MLPGELDILDTVDELTDELDPPRVQMEADRLGLTLDELLRRICNEVKDRLEQG